MLIIGLLIVLLGLVVLLLATFYQKVESIILGAVLFILGLVFIVLSPDNLGTVAITNKNGGVTIYHNCSYSVYHDYVLITTERKERIYIYDPVKIAEIKD